MPRSKVCVNTVWRALQQLNLTLKSRRAREANPEERAAFGEKQLNCWRDGFGSLMNSVSIGRFRAMFRPAPRAGNVLLLLSRLREAKTFRLGISALTLDGVRAPMMIEGAIDGEVLELYVRQFLVPQLRAGDIVIWDNVPTHKNARVLNLIAATGVGGTVARRLAPSQPEGGMHLQLEAELRRVKAETKRKLATPCSGHTPAKVTLQDIRGWFRHCGYAVPDT